MDISLEGQTARTLNRLMLSLVVPRPIAFVTTLHGDGRINAAPFSFFNCMCADPPTLAIGTGYRGEYAAKDTSYNIRREREFVVNLVDEQLVEQMNICATDFGADVEEHVEAGLGLAPGVTIRTPRIASAPAAFECTLFETVDIAPGRAIYIGSVKHIYVRDGLLDSDTMRVDAASLSLVGRMQSPGWYARTGDLFQLRQLTVEEWNAGSKPDALANPEK